MTPKLRALKRLATLYSTLERMRSVQVCMASSAVDEVMRASREEAAVRRARVTDGRTAMVTGNREALAVAAIEHGLATERQRRLEELRITREIIQSEARETHQASRQRMEQVDKIVERTAEQSAREQSRRTQTAADDRYLARRLWAQRFQANPKS